MLRLVPALGTAVKRLVVGFLALLDDALQADVAADAVTALVQQQQREEPSDAAVAVGKRMDALEVEHEGGGGNQRLYLRCRKFPGMQFHEPLHEFRRGKRGNRTKADDLAAVGPNFENCVIRALPPPAFGSA